MTQPQIKLYSMMPMLKAAEQKSLITYHGSAIGAYNVNFYAQALGILMGLAQTEAPGIIQASKGACGFQGGPEYIKDMLLLAATNLGKDVLFGLHLDHGKDDAPKNCCDNGFSSVMIDASAEEFAKNIELTAAIVQYAHAMGISVEGEYGLLKGVEDEIAHEHTVYADPAKVVEFFQKSAADALAIAYGTSHGANKGKTSNLDLSIVSKSYDGLIKEGLNLDHFLVSHGSSRVPAEFVRMINRYGGTLEGTSGVPANMIARAIQLGIRKVNIDTDLRLAMTAQVRRMIYETHPNLVAASKYLQMIKAVFEGEIKTYDRKDTNKITLPGEITDPRDWLQPIMNDDSEILRKNYMDSGDEGFIILNSLLANTVAKHVAALNIEFGSAGLAAKVEAYPSEIITVDRSLTLEEMTRLYKQ